MRKGSISVFLSLVLTLLFSFLLTTLEAARIRGATAYASMVTDLAGESFLASYYYPLFQNYRLFGVNAGDEEGFFSEEQLVNDIQTDVVYGLEEQRGGLLEFRNTNVELCEVETMLSEEEKKFLAQIRQQAVLDGATLMLSELFPEQLFTEAGVIGTVYQKQEEALEVTANVTREILRLMEQVDGIKMSNNGISFDRNGRLQANNEFVKQIVPMELRPIRESYGNEEVYLTVADKFYRVDKAAGRVIEYLGRIAELNRKIDETNKRITEYQNSLDSLRRQLDAERSRLSEMEEPDDSVLLEIQAAISNVLAALEQQQELLKEYKEQKKNLLEAAKGEYNSIVQKVNGVKRVLRQSLNIVKTLEEKQQNAKAAVSAYEVFLEGMKSKLSQEIYDVFEGELEQMKVYAGLEERGFSVAIIRQTLSGNYGILTGLSLSGFSERRLDRVGEEMEALVEGMKGYSTRGLWFMYGDIVVAEDTWENVMGALGELLTTGVLSLVGISNDEVSDCELTGTDLPSADNVAESVLEELAAGIEEVSGLLKDGMGEFLREAVNYVLDGTALELYSMKYFHSYGEETPVTKLKYEREYLIFGADKDKSNLLTMVLYLVAVRTLLCMVMMFGQPERMSQLESLGAGVVGFTGMPVLAAVVKYGVMLLWAVEEALVEVTALLQGKRIAVVGTGTVSFSELLLINKEKIAQKAELLPAGLGAAYTDYLSLFSLTRGTKDKAYRAMDLIQENIRYRYNDSFRIRNVVTELAFCVKTEPKVLFDTGFFPEHAYEITCYEQIAY